MGCMRNNTHEDTEISPSGVIRHVETRIERVSDAVLAELTIASRSRVVQVTSDGGGKGSGVVTAGLSGGRG